VIVNGVDFNKEVIGDSGIWFEPGDPTDLRNKIEYLLVHPEETEKYRRMAAERARKCYSWDDAVDKTEALTKRL